MNNYFARDRNLLILCIGMIILLITISIVSLLLIDEKTKTKNSSQISLKQDNNQTKITDSPIPTHNLTPQIMQITNNHALTYNQIMIGSDQETNSNIDRYLREDGAKFTESIIEGKKRSFLEIKNEKTGSKYSYEFIGERENLESFSFNYSTSKSNNDESDQTAGWIILHLLSNLDNGSDSALEWFKTLTLQTSIDNGITYGLDESKYPTDYRYEVNYDYKNLVIETSADKDFSYLSLTIRPNPNASNKYEPKELVAPDWFKKEHPEFFPTGEENI